MTDGEMRRMNILEILNNRTTPVSGTELAGKLGVSRQVIVQDIALLRADNKEIMSLIKDTSFTALTRTAGNICGYCG